MPHPNPGRHGGTSNSVVSSATLIIGTFSQNLSALLLLLLLPFECLFVLFTLWPGLLLLLLFLPCLSDARVEERIVVSSSLWVRARAL